jgi:hypothetical protein
MKRFSARRVWRAPTATCVNGEATAHEEWNMAQDGSRRAARGAGAPASEEHRGGRGPTTRRGRQVGRPAMPFELPDADGRIHRLADYKGHWLLLVFHRHLG